MGCVGFGVGDGEVRQMFADTIPKKYVELAKVLDSFVKEEDFAEHIENLPETSVNYLKLKDEIYKRKEK